MTVFIGISQKLRFLNLPAGQKSFWCVHKNKDVHAGDLLLPYFTVNASKTKTGIRQIYRITNLRQGEGESECSTRAMGTVDTELLLTLDNGVTVKDMKEDEVTRQLGAVRRHMQGVTFTVDPAIWPALQNLIILRNPNARQFLESE